MATLDDLAASLNKVRRVTRHGCEAITACCPAHNDANPSFYAYAGPDGWLHVHCARCAEHEILGALGWTEEDRKIDGYEHERSPKPLENQEYVYAGPDGQPVFRKTRYYQRGDDGKLSKSFFLEGYQNGQWVKGIQHLNGQRDTLYQLPEVIKHKAAKTIYIVNGEKAANRMRKEKLLATCQPFGEGATPDESRGKWKAAHTRIVEGAKHVVIVADLDEVGEAYAKYIASELAGHVAKVEVVQSRTAKAKDDAYDHLEAGYGVDDFIKRPDLGPKRGLVRRIVTGEFKPVVLTHLVSPWIANGKCYLLDGDGGVGKSSLCLAWAAALSRGLHPVTMEILENGPVKTLYLHKGEDDDTELETIYRANRGVPGMIEYAGDDLQFNPGGLRELQETIDDGGFGLVIVDALFYFIESVVKDSYVAMDVVTVAGGLNLAARASKASFICHRHTTKGTLNKAASELGMGSVQFRNSFRGQLVARKHPEKNGVVVVTDEKGSILNPKAEHFCYRRIVNEVQYLVNEPNPFEAAQGYATNALDSAKRFVTDVLTNEWVDVRSLFAAAKAAGFAQRTMERAKGELPIRYRRGGPDGPVFATIEVSDPFADD